MEAKTDTGIALNIEEIRSLFPILDQEVNGHPLAYFDNAATTQKPVSVIEALSNYYSSYNSNIHRGVHSLAEKATSAFEETRSAIQRFVNARETEEIIFTKGTTESINLVASSFGRKFIGEGDEIIITGMEHHSNIVPWQILCEERGATLKVIPVSESGEISLDDFANLLSSKTKLVSVVMASNALGTINPVKEIIRLASDSGAKTFIDGAQALSHLEVDVQDLNCDFFAGSAHKMYGPTGVGFLFGKRKVLESMTPYQGGGEMIKTVSFEGTTFNEIPFKFEAGTPNIADIIGFKKAIDFIDSIGKARISEHENSLSRHAENGLRKLRNVKIIGEAKKKVSVVSFIIEGMHPFDVGMMLDARGIAVRTGHHCTMPLMNRFEIEGTIRASFAVYNTLEEVDRLISGVEKLVSRLK